MTGIRDLYIGRLSLPTVQGPITEQLGSQLENIGDAPTGAQRKPKGFTLVFPLHGTPGDTNWTAAGNSMRRRLRALMQNHQYRLAGLYLSFDIDPERNGWLVLGEAELADSNGGVPFGDYTLTLSQALLAGQLHTHREAVYLDVSDLRLSTTAVDTLGQNVGLASTFASIAPQPLLFLPPGATDPLTLGAPLASTGSRSSRDGPVPVISGRSDADVVSFERAETDLHTSDVVISDRRGNRTPEAYAVNWIVNPRAGVDTSATSLQTSGTTATVTRVTTDGYQGGTCYQIDAPMGSTADTVILEMNPLSAGLGIPLAVGQLAFLRCAVKLVSGAAATQIALGFIHQDANFNELERTWCATLGYSSDDGVLTPTHVTANVWQAIEGFQSQLLVGSTPGAYVVPALWIMNSASAVSVRVADWQMTTDPPGYPPYVAGDQPGCEWGASAFSAQPHYSVSAMWTPTTVNLLANPSPKIDTSHWSTSLTGGSTGSIARSLAWNEQNVASLQFTGTAAAAPNSAIMQSDPVKVYGGQEMMLRLKANLAVGTVSAAIEFFDSTGTALTVADQVAIPAGENEVIVVTPAPKTAATARAVLIATGGVFDVSADGLELAVNLDGLGPAPTRVWAQGVNEESHQHPGNLTQSEVLSYLRRLHATAIRASVFEAVEVAWPSAGAGIDWESTTFGQWMNIYQAQGVPVVTTFHSVPAWISGSTDPASLTASQATTYAQAIISLCQKYSNVIAVEIVNEPNSLWTGTPEGYINNFLQPIYTAVKAAVPNVVILAGSTAESPQPPQSMAYATWYQRCYAAGLKTACDGLACHTYPWQQASAVSSFGTAGLASNVWWSQYFDSIRQIKATNSDSSRPLWINEYGFSSILSWGGLVPAISESLQASATRVVNGLLRRMPDVQSSILYILAWEYNNVGLLDTGLLGPWPDIRREKPAFAAMADAWTFDTPEYVDGDRVRGTWLGAPHAAASRVYADPQDAFGWEEVYGTDYPLTAADVPVLDNGLCRVRFIAPGTLGSLFTPGFAVDVWDTTVGGWQEQGRVMPYRLGDSAGPIDTLLSVTVGDDQEQWTPERGVLQLVMRASGDAYSREVVCVSLQRGWTGPRFEIYASAKADGTAPITALEFVAAGQPDPNSSILKIDSGGVKFTATAGTGTNQFPGAQVGDGAFTGENWAAFLRQNAGWQIHIAVPQYAQSVSANYLNQFVPHPYGSSNHNALSVGAAAYNSARFGFSQQSADQMLEAEAIASGSGTSSIVTDAAASSGSAVKETQTSSANTVVKNATGLAQAKYRVMARVRVGSGVTGSLLAFLYSGSSFPSGPTVTTTSNTYVWLDLGEMLAPIPNPNLGIHAWVSAGTAANGVFIDRVELVKAEDRARSSAPFDGTRDLGQATLSDVRQRPRLVSRAG